MQDDVAFRGGYIRGLRFLLMCILAAEARCLGDFYRLSYCSQERVPAAHSCVFTQDCAAPPRITINFIAGM